MSIAEVKDLYSSLEEEGVAILTRQGVPGKEMKLIRGAEIRYFGQLQDIEVLMPETKRGEPFREETLKALISEFHNRHQAMYGWADPAIAVTISTLKLQAIGMRRPLELIKQPFSGKDASAALKRKRQAYFKELGGFVEARCYDADRLRHGNVINGPAIVEAAQTTLVVPQGTELAVDAYENYALRRV